MSKPTARQLEMIECCQRFLSYMAQSNDIHSPSHLCDADIAFNNMDDYDLDAVNSANENFARAENALRELCSAIVAMDECPMRAAEVERIKRIFP